MIHTGSRAFRRLEPRRVQGILHSTDGTPTVARTAVVPAVSPGRRPLAPHAKVAIPRTDLLQPDLQQVSDPVMTRVFHCIPDSDIDCLATRFCHSSNASLPDNRSTWSRQSGHDQPEHLPSHPN
jgi:hypothetical protein